MPVGRRSQELSVVLILDFRWDEKADPPGTQYPVGLQRLYGLSLARGPI
jgi:hypothetical protein